MNDAATTADWITAFATLIAAGGTVGALIYAARAATAANRSAVAAVESADAARDAVRHEALPLLLDVPYEHYTDMEHEYPWPLEREGGTSKTPMRGQVAFHAETGTFAIPVRNVGRGVARIEDFEISFKDGSSYRQFGGEAIPVGEEIWLAGRPVERSEFAQALKRQPSPLHEYMPLFFVVSYTDNSGKQRQRLEFGLGAKGGESAWRVLRTANVRLDDEAESA
jgi:hypothetical protein